MAEQHNLTVAEFNQQVIEFRKLFGDKTFWAKPAPQRNLAIKGFGLAYLFLKPETPKEDVNRCAEVFQQTMEEYHRRELMLIQMGKVDEPA